VLEHRLSIWAARIVNARAYRALGAQGFTRAPVGTGPFRLETWGGGVLRLAAHDDYFGGRPNVRAIEFREVPLLSSRIAGLQAGEFDIINQVAADQIAIIARRADLEVRPATIGQWQALWLWGAEPVMGDARRRQALALAIDRNLLVSTLQGGLVPAATSFQAPSFAPFYEAGRAGFAYDPECARRLLRESGYSNEPVVLRLVANYYAAGEAVAQAIVEMWRAVGVNARLEIVENFTQARGAGRDVVFGGCSYSFPTPEGLGPCFLAANNWTEQYGFPDGVGGLRGLAAELAAAHDTAARQTAFRRILDELETQAPVVPLYIVPQHFAAKRTVRWTPYADFAMDFRAANLQVIAATQ
jgi:peptide/nickel transport system substrate-binding protein